MPPTLNRRAVELALPLSVRGYLHDLLECWGIHVHDRWPDHRLIRKHLELTAVQNLRARKMRGGLSQTAALRVACQELGLSHEAIKSSLRGRKKYLDAAATVVSN